MAFRAPESGAQEGCGHGLAGEGDLELVGVGLSGLELEAVFAEAQPGLLMQSAQETEPEGGVRIALAVRAISGLEALQIPERERRGPAVDPGAEVLNRKRSTDGRRAVLAGGA